jgi:hypothetical protein
VSSIPNEARAILADGDFCYVAAAAPSGPHLTPVVFAYDGGRLWLTTSRGSLKARVWRSDPRVAGLVRAGDRAVTFRGRVRTYDALDPFTWPLAVIGSGRLLRAATRFTLKNARFFFGYAVDATEVPLMWAPPGRIFDGIELRAGRVLDLTTGQEAGGWGSWELGSRGRAHAAAGTSPRTNLPTARRASAAASPARALERGVPASVLGALGTSGDGVLAVRPEPGSGPLTVLPVRWTRAGGAFEVRLPAALLALASAGPAPVVGLTVDQASTWRARQMRGMLLRGPARVARAGRRREDDAVLVLRPERAVWWEGWTSGTVPLTGARARRAMRDPA